MAGKPRANSLPRNSCETSPLAVTALSNVEALELCACTATAMKTAATSTPPITDHRRLLSRMGAQHKEG